MLDLVLATWWGCLAMSTWAPHKQWSLRERHGMLLSPCSCFLNGAPPNKQMAMLLRLNKMIPIIHFRSLMVNRYPAIESKRWGTRRIQHAHAPSCPVCIPLANP